MYHISHYLSVFVDDNLTYSNKYQYLNIKGYQRSFFPTDGVLGVLLSGAPDPLTPPGQGGRDEVQPPGAGRTPAEGKEHAPPPLPNSIQDCPH